MRLFAVLAGVVVVGCAPGHGGGVFSGTTRVVALSNGCGTFPKSAEVALSLAVETAAISITAEGSSISLDGTIDADGWFRAERNFEVDANNWGYQYADGQIEGDVAHYGEFFDGELAGKFCWVVMSAVLHRR